MIQSNLSHAEVLRTLVGQLYWVDVGSRGGFREMSMLHPLVHMYSIDADAHVEQRFSNFASFQHFSTALYSRSGPLDLLVTQRPSMSSLLEFDENLFLRHFGLMAGSETWRDGLRLAKRQQIVAQKADDFFRDQGLRNIDFLKLDTQGTELDILRGALEYLSSHRIAVVKTEFSFFRVYKDQCVFSELDQFLREQGFIFVDCIFYPDSVYERAKRRAICGVTLTEQPRFSAGGDAVYVLDPTLLPRSDQEQFAMRSAIILNQMGYSSLAFDFLASSDLTYAKREEILNRTKMNDPIVRLKRTLRDQLPPWAYRAVRRLRLRRSI